MPDYSCEQYRDFVAHVGRRAHAQAKASAARPPTVKLAINPGITTPKHKNKSDRSQNLHLSYEKRKEVLEKIISRMLQDGLLLGVNECPDEFEVNLMGKFPYHLAKMNCPWIYEFMELSECPEQSVVQFEKIEQFLVNTDTVAATALMVDEENNYPPFDDPGIRLWTNPPQVCDEYLDFIHAVVYLSLAAKGYECIISETIFSNRFDETRRENNRASKTIRGTLRLMCLDSILSPVKGADGCFVLHPDCPTQDYMSKRKGGFEQQHHWVWGICRSKDFGINVRTLDSFLQARGTADENVSVQLKSECFAFEAATDLRLLADNHDKEDSELKQSITEGEQRNQLPEWCTTQLAKVRLNNPDYRFHISITTSSNFGSGNRFHFTCHDCGLKQEGPGIELASPNHPWWENSVVAHAEDWDHLLAKVSKLIRACKSIPKHSSLHRRLERLDESVTAGTDASKWEPALACPKWATLFAWKARSTAMLEDPWDPSKLSHEVADESVVKLAGEGPAPPKRSSDGSFLDHGEESGTESKRPRLEIDLNVGSSGLNTSSNGFKPLVVEVVDLSSRVGEVVQRLRKLEEENQERHNSLQEEHLRVLTGSHATTSTHKVGEIQPDQARDFSQGVEELGLVEVYSRLEALESRTEEQSSCLEGARTFCTDVGDEILTLTEQSIEKEQRIAELESQLEAQKQTVETLARQNELMMKRMQKLEDINEKLTSHIMKSGGRGYY
ncbi:hypothetical protein BDZ45DRAFT_803502 [Acephala macrosclerotiorum]|nr:hypothetical protein BDZ45DRAFT_803502 [Acephala macrosclerotiorum]